MKNIAIVATGGTIAGTGENGKTVSYQAGEISVENIIETIPVIKKIANIKAYQLFNVDSNEITESDWIVLSNKINELVMDVNVDGIVVTHGTDVIEETAYYLTLTLNTQKPVVITGAMRPATATSADGPYNLYQAVALASHPDAFGKGVMGLFSNTIYSGRDIQKVNNYKIDAFDQKSFGCLGYMQDDQVYFFSNTFKHHTVSSMFAGIQSQLPAVGIAYFYAGADESILYFLAQTHKGIVIVGSGNGNYNKKWLKAIEELSQKGIVFVRSSRVPQGIVFNDCVFDPHDLCISANTLSGQKARVLLMLALTKTNDIKEIRRIFELY
ncbi:MAG: asparaginase [Bacilli bacterium]|nr:asparaginase [Bacilli bacterium]